MEELFMYAFITLRILFLNFQKIYEKYDKRRIFSDRNVIVK